MRSDVRRILALCLLCAVMAQPAYAGGPVGDEIEKNAQLRQREERVAEREARLDVLGREIDGKIRKYSEILEEIRQMLSRISGMRDANHKHMIKIFESMEAGTVAQKLSTLEEQTAVGILLGMTPKKAGAVMARMPSEKATRLTRQILLEGKNLPAK